MLDDGALPRITKPPTPIRAPKSSLNYSREVANLSKIPTTPLAQTYEHVTTRLTPEPERAVLFVARLGLRAIDAV